MLCANCGKGEECSGDLKSCAACMLVKYCSRDCQIAHRPQHKKKCKKRAAELFDEALFKEPPPREECPICMLRGATFRSCCGKNICEGCDYAMYMVDSKVGGVTIDKKRAKHYYELAAMKGSVKEEII